MRVYYVVKSSITSFATVRTERLQERFTNKKDVNNYVRMLEQRSDKYTIYWCDWYTTNERGYHHELQN